MEVNKQVLNPVAGKSKTLASGRCLPGIAFSNSLWGIDMCRP